MKKKLLSVFLCVVLALLPVMSLAEEAGPLDELKEAFLKPFAEGRRVEFTVDAKLPKAIRSLFGDKASEFTDKLSLKIGFQMSDTLQADVDLYLGDKQLYSKALEIQDDGIYLRGNLYGDKVYAIKPGEYFGINNKVVNALTAKGITKEDGFAPIAAAMLNALGNDGAKLDSDEQYPTSLDEFSDYFEALKSGFDFSNSLTALAGVFGKVEAEELKKPVDPIEYISSFKHDHAIETAINFDNIKADKGSYTAYILKANFSNSDIISLIEALAKDVKKQEIGKEYSSLLDIAPSILGGLLKSVLKDGITVEVYLDTNGNFLGLNIEFKVSDLSGKATPVFLSFMKPSVKGYPLYEAKGGLIDEKGNTVPHFEFAAYVSPSHYSFILNLGPVDSCILEIVIDAQGDFTGKKAKGSAKTVIHCPPLFGEDFNLVGDFDIKGENNGTDFNFKTDIDLAAANGKEELPFLNLKIGVKTTDPLEAHDFSKEKLVNVGELSEKEFTAEVSEAIDNIAEWLTESFSLIPESLQEYQKPGLEQLLEFLS